MVIAMLITVILLIGQQQGICVKQSTLAISPRLTIKHNKTTFFPISEVSAVQFGLVSVISRYVDPNSIRLSLISIPFPILLL